MYVKQIVSAVLRKKCNSLLRTLTSLSIRSCPCTVCLFMNCFNRICTYTQQTNVLIELRQHAGRFVCKTHNQSSFARTITIIHSQSTYQQCRVLSSTCNLKKCLMILKLKKRKQRVPIEYRRRIFRPYLTSSVINASSQHAVNNRKIDSGMTYGGFCSSMSSEVATKSDQRVYLQM